MILSMAAQENSGDNSIMDVIIALQIVVGQIEPTPLHFGRGDLDLDDEIGLPDAISIIQNVVGDSSLPKEC